jgi:hypothetical protein
MIMGYAMVYTGAANFANGGAGPTLAQSLGITTPVAGPGKAAPNLTGQPVVGAVGGSISPVVGAVGGSVQSAGAGGGGGGGSY